MILSGHGSDAALQQAIGGKGAGVIARLEAADDAGQRIDRAGIERMRDSRDAFGLEIGDRLGDLVAEIDAADAEIALLDAGGLAVDLDLEPDAPDAGRLHREIAGLAGNAGVGLDSRE